MPKELDIKQLLHEFLPKTISFDIKIVKLGGKEYVAILFPLDDKLPEQKDKLPEEKKP